MFTYPCKKEGGGPSLVEVTVEVVDRGFPLIPEHSDSKKPPLDHQGKSIPKEKLHNPEFARSLGGRSTYEQFNKRKIALSFRSVCWIT